MNPTPIIIDWLKALPSAPAGLSGETALIEEGIVNSIELLNIVAFLEERFAITLPVEAFEPGHFRTAEAIGALVETLRQGGTP